MGQLHLREQRPDADRCPSCGAHIQEAVRALGWINEVGRIGVIVPDQETLEETKKRVWALLHDQLSERGHLQVSTFLTLVEEEVHVDRDTALEIWSDFLEDGRIRLTPSFTIKLRGEKKGARHELAANAS